jgi:hypothetical protein
MTTLATVLMAAGTVWAYEPKTLELGAKAPDFELPGGAKLHTYGF